jgi:hypothetical protein
MYFVENLILRCNQSYSAPISLKCHYLYITASKYLFDLVNPSIPVACPILL